MNSIFRVAVLMSSQVLQVTPHIVGLAALCTGTRTLSHHYWLSKSVNSFTFELYETFGKFPGCPHFIRELSLEEHNVQLGSSRTAMTRSSWTFPCAVLNSLGRSTCVQAAIVNISALTYGRKMPSGFTVCFKHGLVDHTIRSFMMMFFALIIMLFDRKLSSSVIFTSLTFMDLTSNESKRLMTSSMCSLEKLHCHISF